MILPNSKPIDVTVLLIDGGLASTAIAPMEVFRSAGVIWQLLQGRAAAPAFRVRSACLDDRPIQSDGPLQLVPETRIDRVRQTDLIVVPAIGMDTDGQLARHRRLVDWLARRYAHGTAVAGICSGVAILAEAGLLDGRPATTHWGLVERYRQRYPCVDWQPERFVTEADEVYCGGGVYASLDLSLYLVEKYAGRETAIQCAKGLLIDTPRTWQSGFSSPPLRAGHADAKILRAQRWLHEHFGEDFRMDDLAANIGMSPRNFARRFKQATGETPLTYLHKLRIDASKRLLEADYRTVQEIAGLVGYEDIGFFRDLFHRYAGVSPQAYRQRFGQRAVPAPTPDHAP